MLLTSQFPSMCMVRSPKAIAGAVGLALGNAPYSDSDHFLLSATGNVCITQSLPARRRSVR
ncbi:MAG: hypothetical protein EWV63_15455 [Microcystis aeruginosa Ma_OC_H_19870700_S124]|uniref:Uncharacterized protein n=1 Tax=Microcystis aeruginosa Ma_OC_H_19870700_S124 TaxID=2486262 RepID=A0A552AG00_MICAE|nr:MAG: hypothetical protein EWV63_15455 [Microcystis aeruginosa Ma_OC_H_19870700_S124]